MKTNYPTDLTDAEWEHIEPFVPAPKCRGPHRIHSLREILNAVFYVLRSGCPWRLVRREYPPYRPRKTTKPAEVRFRALLTEGGAELLELSRV